MSLKIVYCLDFDGTLVRIRRDPDKVFPSKEAVKFLEKVIATPHRHVAVISGRAFKDLKKRLPIKGLMMVGSHGRESTDEDLKVAGPSGGSREKFLNLLKKEFGKLPGIHFEKKPHSFVIHYRQAATPIHQRVEAWFAERNQEFKKSSAHLLRAKKAYEISSYPANKGHIIKKIKKKFPGAKLVIAGDDVTDQDMFKAASKRDLTIGVGAIKGAKRRVAGPVEMLKFLKKFEQKTS